MRPSSFSDSAVPSLGWVSLAGILLTSAIGFIASGIVELAMEANQVTLYTGIMLLVGIVSVVSVRTIALPSMAKRDDLNLSTIAMTGYGYAEAAAILGAATAVFSGEGWRVLPFLVITLITWVLVRRYLDGLRPPATTEDFPRL